MRLRVAVLSLALAMTGCGLLSPSPARNRPPLPPGQPLPDLAAEDLVAQLELLGYACGFDRGGDIPSRWSCSGPEQDDASWISVGFTSGRDGPINLVGAHVQADERAAPDAIELDRMATAVFDDVVALVVPEEHRPTADALFVGVQRNYPIELGGGWYLGFDRASVNRRLTILFAEDPT